MSMMEFYPSSTGAEENLSLQDMIEFDMNNGEGEHWRAQTPNQDFLMPQTSVLDGYSSKTPDSDLTGENWMQLSQGSDGSTGSIQENTNPNLMVNPQTGVPIGQEQGTPTPPAVTLSAAQPAVDNTQSPSRGINSQAIISLGSSTQSGGRDNPQIIRVTQPQFVNINNVMTVVASTSQAQQVFIHGNGGGTHTTTTMSPLRQQLQNLHHLQQQQQQQQHSPNVTYATTQQLLTQGLASPQKISMRSLVDHHHLEEKVFPKPVYSYSCLIAMSLKNSDSGCLPVSEIYNFMTEHFPYFKTAPDGWKNSVRHNLSLNKCFEKIENPKSNGNTKKGCLWAMNPAKIDKMDDEISKWRKKDLVAIKRSMSKPEVLELLEKGLGKPSIYNTQNSGNSSSSSSTTTTPAHDNNNTSKVITTTTGSTATVNPVTAAILGHNHITVVKQEPQQQQQTVSVNANVNVIEIKPNHHHHQNTTTIKLEPNAKMEVDIKDLNNITFNSDDLNALDNSLTLDPALNDLALQNGLFDDLGSEDLNLDALPSGNSPLSFFANGISASPLTVPTAGAPIKMETEVGNPPPYTLTNITGRLPSPPPYSAASSGQTPAGAGLPIIRTVSAPT